METLMNKSDLVGIVAAELDCSRQEASRAIDAVLGGISKGVGKSGNVRLSGFGSFTRRTRAGRTVLNPSTGEPIEIEPSISVGFRAGTRLREAVKK